MPVRAVRFWRVRQMVRLGRRRLQQRRRVGGAVVGASGGERRMNAARRRQLRSRRDGRVRDRRRRRVRPGRLARRLAVRRPAQRRRAAASAAASAGAPATAEAAARARDGGRSRRRSPGSAAGGFQPSSFSFQMWTSALFASGASFSTSLLRVNGPVRLPSSAMYHWTRSSPEPTAASEPVGRRTGADGAAGASRSGKPSVSGAEGRHGQLRPLGVDPGRFHRDAQRPPGRRRANGRRHRPTAWATPQTSAPGLRER